MQICINGISGDAFKIDFLLSGVIEADSVGTFVSTDNRLGFFPPQTGTLTEDGLDLWGIQRADEGR